VRGPLPVLLGAAALLGLSGCGGGSNAAGGTGSSSGGSATAGGLSYVDPPNPGGLIALVRDPASTPANLVLDLVSPQKATPVPAIGVTFGFSVDPAQAAWAQAAGGAGQAAVGSTLFALAGNLSVVRGWVSGGQLQGIAANKGAASQVPDIGNGQGKVIATLTLTPVPGGPAGPVGLVDSGLGEVLNASGVPVAFQVAVGTLTLQ
jgi:hypothetical protein